MAPTAAACAMSRQVAGLALHALEPDEEIAARHHLRGCPECVATLRAHHEVLAAVAVELGPSVPPTGLRERILEGVSRQDAPGPPAGPVASRHARPPRRRWPVALAVAACVIAVGGLAGQAVGMQHQRDAEVAQSRDLGRIVTGLDVPGSRHATLSDAAGRAVAAVVTTPDSVQVVSADLPENDRSSVYVVWAVPDTGPPVALGVFDATAGRTDVTTLPGASGGATTYAVSLEPGRTAPAAPTRPVARGTVV
jgi:anti-sigma-K factor RskA